MTSEQVKLLFKTTACHAFDQHINISRFMFSIFILLKVFQIFILHLEYIWLIIAVIWIFLDSGVSAVIQQRAKIIDGSIKIEKDERTQIGIKLFLINKGSIWERNFQKLFHKADSLKIGDLF